jgi:hypothetical protein
VRAPRRDDRSPAPWCTHPNRHHGRRRKRFRTLPAALPASLAQLRRRGRPGGISDSWPDAGGHGPGHGGQAPLVVRVPDSLRVSAGLDSRGHTVRRARGAAAGVGSELAPRTGQPTGRRTAPGIPLRGRAPRLEPRFYRLAEALTRDQRAEQRIGVKLALRVGTVLPSAQPGQP